MSLLWVLLLPVPLSLCGFWRYRRRQRLGRHCSLRKVFSARALRELDAHLDRVAMEEQTRLTSNAVDYLAGVVGHVVGVAATRHAIALSLSDGRLFALGSVSRRSLALLLARAQEDRLRPTRLEKMGSTFRLLLQGEAGSPVAVYARRLAVTA